MCELLDAAVEALKWYAEQSNGECARSHMKPTLKPKTSFFADGRRYGIAEHQDGDHTCHVPYRTAREGENIAGQNMAIVKEDGTYEMLMPGTKPCDGPAQVATAQYRNGWERAFGARGGVS